MLADIKPPHKGYATMSKHNVIEIKNRDTITDALTEMLKAGAQQLIHQSVQAELAVFMEQHSNQSTDGGRASVVRNGYQPERKILTGIGSVPVKIPKVRSNPNIARKEVAIPF